MKFTSEDLMKAMGLQVGDRVKYGIYTYEVENDFTLFRDSVKTGDRFEFHYEKLEFLLNKDFEILPRLKRIGDLKCVEYECAKCPLRTIRCDKNDDICNSLYYILENVLVGADFDQEIYDLLKARLDKVVEE